MKDKKKNRPGYRRRYLEYKQQAESIQDSSEINPQIHKPQSFLYFSQHRDDTCYTRCLSRVTIWVEKKLQPTDFSSYNFLREACLLAQPAYALTPWYCIMCLGTHRTWTFYESDQNPKRLFCFSAFFCRIVYRTPSLSSKYTGLPKEIQKDQNFLGIFISLRR